jgi:hypothetical protein
MIRWFANAVTVVGTSLLAFHIGASPWAYPFMLLGSVIWLWWGWKKRDWPLAALQGFFTLINIIGTVRWLG